MPVSEAHKRASYKWNASRDSITIRPEKETGEKIRDAAKRSGKSVQNYILEAIEMRMDAEKADTGIAAPATDTDTGKEG